MSEYTCCWYIFSHDCIQRGLQGNAMDRCKEQRTDTDGDMPIACCVQLLVSVGGGILCTSPDCSCCTERTNCRAIWEKSDRTDDGREPFVTYSIRLKYPAATSSRFRFLFVSPWLGLCMTKSNSTNNADRGIAPNIL